ncbi:MAG: hypothetical protein KDK34_07810 [Leptospiraceae bacterium]|nr:hypothetical protein [Leptospiraceae bacterium]
MFPLRVVNFYKFFPIADPQATGRRWLQLMKERGLTGTLLLAPEGANNAVAGPEENIKTFLHDLHHQGEMDLSGVMIKWMPARKMPFKKAKLKVKDQIVTTAWHPDLEMNADTFLSPHDWDRLARDPDTVIIDTRNDYEYYVGSFRNAIKLPLNEFDEFDRVVPELESLKQKTVLTFCTGGIRCEKAVPLLKSKGFERVYQLEGGIINYFQTMGQGLWEGECFVFDYRCTIQPDLRPGTYTFCGECGQPTRDGLCVQCNEREYRERFGLASDSLDFTN